MMDDPAAAAGMAGVMPAEAIAAAGGANDSGLSPEDPHFWGGGSEDYGASFPADPAHDVVDYTTATGVAAPGTVPGMDGAMPMETAAAAVDGSSAAAMAYGHPQGGFKVEAADSSTQYYDAATAATMMSDASMVCYILFRHISLYVVRMMFRSRSTLGESKKYPFQTNKTIFISFSVGTYGLASGYQANSPVGTEFTRFW